MKKREVGGGVGLDLGLGEDGAGLGSARGVADHGRVVADDENGLVTEVLKLPQFPQNDGMSKREVGRRRVHAQLDAQAFPFCQTIL